MFDTHCHLNFSAFKKTLPDVVKRAKDAGVAYFVVPGTDVERSVKAIEVAEKYTGVFAAVGIHPHHVFEFKGENEELRMEKELKEIEKLLSNAKVVAVGEIGLDKHIYGHTKYENYQIDENFINKQKTLLRQQIALAIQYNKSLILHNREAKAEILQFLSEVWHKKLEERSVFHCCEPDMELLEFAKQHKMFIGVDGDITYNKAKQEFIKKVPLDMLVLETDSPFLLPEPLRTQKAFPNEPKNIPLIADFIAKILGKDPEEIKKITTENAQVLFRM